MTTPRMVVYVEVTNAINIPFNTGIQRVVMRLLQELEAIKKSGLTYIPIFYNHYSKTWHSLNQYEHAVLLQKRNKWPKYFHRIRMIAKTLLQALFKSNQIAFEKNALWLDLEACWNNVALRKELLPALKKIDITPILFVHDILPLIKPAYFKDKTVAEFKQFFSAHLNHTNTFICNSKTTLAYLQDFLHAEKISDKNCYSIPLGSDFTIHNKPSTKTEYGRYIICVGTLEVRKNHKILLDAFDVLASQYEDLSLVIVGKEGWKIEDTLERMRNSKHFNKRIFWLRNISDLHLQSLYANAYLSVFPSLCEGLGLPAIESLHMGVVTLCSDIPALNEAAGSFADYFKHSDYNELVELIKNYLDNEERYDLKKKSLENYSSPRWIDAANEINAQLLTVYS